MSKKSKPSHGANRQYKDSAFALALTEEEGAIVSLTNAIFGTNYAPDTAVDISTLKRLLNNCSMNDLSYIIDGRLIILIEHQSTINENMPYRMLEFYTESIKRLHAEKDMYRKLKIEIQRPYFVVLYNGKEAMPEDVMTLRLSDMFAKRKPEDPIENNLELIVKMYNINKGHNEEIVNRCVALRDYSIFIAMIREYQTTMNLEEAIQKAVVDCIDQDVLKNFLLKHKGEVVNMLYPNFNMKLAVEVAKEEGMTIGERKNAAEVAKRMIKADKDVDEIVRFSGLDIDDVLKLMGTM